MSLLIFLKKGRCAVFTQVPLTDLEFKYEEEEISDGEGERDLRPVVRRTAKHIAAGEERPRTNSSQQTTPTDGNQQLIKLYIKLAVSYKEG